MGRGFTYVEVFAERTRVRSATADRLQRMLNSSNTAGYIPSELRPQASTKLRLFSLVLRMTNDIHPTNTRLLIGKNVDYSVNYPTEQVS